MPRLRAAEGPALRCVSTFTRPSYLRSTSGVSSVEPSSATMISNAGSVCANTDSNAATSHAERLYDGMTTENRITARTPSSA